MNQSEMNRLHDSGKMPSWAYYQQNGKSAQENYNEQRQIILRGYKKKKDDESILFMMMKEFVEGTMKDLFKEITQALNQG